MPFIIPLVVIVLFLAALVLVKNLSGTEGLKSIKSAVGNFFWMCLQGIVWYLCYLMIHGRDSDVINGKPLGETPNAIPVWFVIFEYVCGTSAICSAISMIKNLWNALFISTNTKPDDITMSDNIRRWKESGRPDEWVRKHHGNWGQQEWEDLLHELKLSQYWPMKPEQIGEELERIKRA